MYTSMVVDDEVHAMKVMSGMEEAWLVILLAVRFGAVRKILRRRGKKSHEVGDNATTQQQQS